MEAQVFPTKPLLRPDQVDSAKSEMQSLEAKLKNKHIEDKAEVQRQLRRARKDFETQVPRAPDNAAQEDAMVKRARALLEEITPGMLSQEEMRKAPPGAVERHMAWERRNKAKIMEWRHITRRLYADAPADDAAAATLLDRHRPATSSLNMDNAFIPGKQIYLPDSADGLGVTFSESQLALLRELDPGLADKIGTLSNRQRSQVKQIVDGIGLDAPSPASIAGRKGAEKKRQMSAEQKQKMADGRAAAKAKREAKEKE